MVLHLNKLESPSHKDSLCKVCLKLAQWFLRRLLNFINVFSQFCNYLPWKRAGPFIWTNLNPHHSRMLCAKFGWNWPCGSREEYCFNFINVFSLFCNYLPLEKDRALYLNKPESPSPKDALCKVWLKLTQWFLRRFLNLVNVPGIIAIS